MEKRTLCARVFAVRLLSAALATSLFVSQTSPAWAQTEMERAGAREAAKEGAKAFGEKRWTDAIDLFTRAESLVHAPPHLLYLARASANMGQLVKARENYLKITRDKIAAGAPKAFVEAQTSANKELADLEPRIPSIKAQVAGGEGKTVKLMMDGKEVSNALVGLSMPVDPGEHTFKATADGMASDEVRVSLRERAKESVSLTLKPAAGAAAVAPIPTPPVAGTAPLPPGAPAAAAPAPGVPPPAQPGAPPPAAPPPAPEQGSSGSGLRIGGFVIAGLGLVGGGVLGAMFLTKSSSKKDEASSLYNQCNPVGCTADQQATISTLDNQSRDEKKSSQTTGVIAIGAGGALVVTGLVMVLLAGGGKDKPAESPKSATITPVVGLGSVGLAGHF
jgi:hypothetical protein